MNDPKEQLARLLEWAKKVRNDPLITLRIQQVWEFDELLKDIEGDQNE